jgi:hypothetical protein
MKPKYDLRVEPVNESHIAPYAELSTIEFGPDAPMSRPDHLRWKFLANPAGPSMGSHLYSDGRLVGRIVGWPRLLAHDGTDYRAGMGTDLLIHQDHRQPASLVQLFKGNQQFDFDLWLSVAPNAIGWQLSKKYGRMPEVFDLDVAVLPLKPLDILRTRRSGVPRVVAKAIDGGWRWTLAALASVNWCGSRCSISDQWPEPTALGAFAGIGRDFVVGKRDYAFLDWRFRQGPVFKADVSFLYRGDSLVGYLAIRRMDYLGLDCSFVVDAFGLPELTPRDWGAAIRSLISREARNGSQMIAVIGNGSCPLLSPLVRLPFIRIPRSRLPRRLTVFARPRPGLDLKPDDRNFHMTLADYDVA